MPFKLKYNKSSFPFKGESDGFTYKGYNVVREDLDEGILGEAENGNTIKLDNSIKPGSKKEKEVMAHEAHHQDEMKSGKLAYDDKSVTDKIAGKKYARKDGKLIDQDSGIAYSEGDPNLPHESRAFKISNKIKNLK